jgi:CheY-like chemotaxis protein
MTESARHVHVSKLLGAWAIGAVDDDEAALISVHLEECDRCRADAAGLHDAVAALPSSQGPPPERIWERVLSTLYSRVGSEAEDWLQRSLGAGGDADPIRVALVDDEPDIRFLWRASLKRAGGFEVVGEAGDGGAAVMLAAREQPTVLILDLAMPGRSGLDALTEIERHSPETKVLACSSYEELLFEATDQGAAGVFLKTEPLELLARSVRLLALG